MSNGRTAVRWSVYVHHILCSFFVVSQMKKEGKNRGQRFHMILENAFWSHECGCCACEFRAPGWIGLGNMPQYVSAYFVATDSVLGLDQTAYRQSVARPFSWPRTAPWIVF